MSKETQIEFIDYEQDRLMFFVNELSLAQRKYDRLFKTFKDAPYMSEGAVFLSDAGREVQFYKDVVEMLDKGYLKQEWISVEERLPETEGDARTWGELKIRKSVRVLCACRQKSGKVFVKEGYCELWGSKVVWKIPGTVDSVTHWMPLPEAPKGGVSE